MRIVRLSHRPEPDAGEGLPSYLDRVAAEHDVTLAMLLRHIGLILPGEKRPPFYGIDLPNDRLHNLIDATGLEAKTLDAMLVRSLPGADAVDLTERVWAMRLTNTLWVGPGSSNACPRCLAERGSWRLSWKSSLAFSCARHQMLLISHCPGCGRRLGHGSDRGATYPPLLDQPHQPGRCRERHRDHKRVPCLFELTTVASTSLAGDPWRLDTQRRIDALLGGEAMYVTGHHMGAAEALREVRTACAMVLHTAEPDELPLAHAPLAVAFEQHVGRRQSEDRRHTYLKGPHENPALMAATVPVALDLLMADDETELRVRVSGFAERLPRHARRTGPANLAGRFGLTPLLERAVSAHLERVRPVHVFERARRAAGYPSHNCWSFTPCHVPQLYWADRFGEDLASLFPAKRVTAARRFSSLALVRFAFSLGGAQSAHALELDGRAAASSANHFLCELTQQSLLPALLKGLWSTAWWLERQWRPINYASRRRALAELRRVPEALCPEARLPTCLPWPQLCAAWLWADLTSGDPFEAPALPRRLTRRQREAFHRFTTTALSVEHRTHLREYGSGLLADASLRTSLTETSFGTQAV